MCVEIARFERPYPGRGAGMGDEQIRAEGEEAADRVGRAGDDRAVGVLRTCTSRPWVGREGVRGGRGSSPGGTV